MQHKVKSTIEKNKSPGHIGVCEFNINTPRDPGIGED